MRTKFDIYDFTKENYIQFYDRQETQYVFVTILWITNTGLDLSTQDLNYIFQY